MNIEEIKSKIKYYFDKSQVDAINKYYYLSLAQVYLDILRGVIKNEY